MRRGFTVQFALFVFCTGVFAGITAIRTPHHAFEIWRHGARSPLNQYFMDPAQPVFCTGKHTYLYSDASSDALVFDLVYDDHPFIPGEGCADGILTSRGWDQHHSAGERSRARFVDDLGLLPSDYHAEHIQYRSTHRERTIESLQAHMQGMYPDISGVIPVKTAESAFEYISPRHITTGSCWRHDLALRRHFDAVNADRTASAALRFPCTLLRGSQCGVRFISDYEKAWDAAGMRAENGWRVLPDRHGSTAWAGAATEATDDLAAEVYNDMDYTRAVYGHGFGFLASELRRVTAEGYQGPKFDVWSTHDTVVAPLTAALRTEGGLGWPKLAGSIQLLVRKGSEDGQDSYTLSARIYDQDVHLLPEGCTECPMERVLEYLDSLAVPTEEMDKWCREIE